LFILASQFVTPLSQRADVAPNNARDAKFCANWISWMKSVGLPRTSYDSSKSSGSVLSQRALYIGQLGPDACFKPAKLLEVGCAALAVLGFKARTKALL
jgi:hypothetical protein